jgi:Asp-tRNA(Asn)/Glu-tRNA(Gln) amidotransferase A subunit family amidase
MQTVLEADPWSFDEASLNVPWRIVSAPTRPLRFGLITEDPKRPLHPTMLRTMRAASTALTTAGHTVLPIDHLVPSLWDTATLSWQNFMLDPQQIAAKNILVSGEPWVQSVIKTRNPDLEHWTASLDGLFDMNVARQQIVKAYRDIMLGNQLDAVILPPYQATAVPHDTWGVVVYTVLANCLDYPAGSIPFLKADKAADEEFVRGDVVYEPPCKFTCVVDDRDE